MKTLIMSLVLLLLMPVLAFGRHISNEELERSACRVRTDGGYGTGITYQLKDKYYYIATNNHVVDDDKNVELDYFQPDLEILQVKGEVIWTAFHEVWQKGVDFAIIKVSSEEFGDYKPILVPFAPVGTELFVDQRIRSVGLPHARWPMRWIGKITKIAGVFDKDELIELDDAIVFNFAPIPGQSGSGICIDIKDEEGNIDTYIGALLTMTNNQIDGGWGIAARITTLRGLLAAN